MFGQERVRVAALKLGLDEVVKGLEAQPLIDWAELTAAKLALMRALFDDLGDDLDAGDFGDALARFRARGGVLLENMCDSKPSTHGTYKKIGTAGIGEAGRSHGKTQTARRCEHSRRRIAARLPFTCSCSGSPMPRWPLRKRGHGRWEWGSA